jgi:hypothetical protein
MGKLSSAGSFLVLLFFLHIKKLSLSFLLLIPTLLNLARLLWHAQASLTWLNLLSVQPRGAHTISFPRLAREAHGTHSLKRAIKDPGVSTGSVTLQIGRGKVIGCSLHAKH